jgi:N-acetylglucosaminyl-diphospho-decaprenol L-rhamnosyltransferase
MPPTISVIIVSWNVRDLLTECLDSLPASCDDPLECIVVDSASTDGTADMLRERFPHVRLLAQDSNVGFSRGCNIGLQAAQGELLLLLNPDTVVRPGALTVLAAALTADPAAGLAGPLTFNGDGTVQSTRRRFPDFWTGVFDTSWLQRFAPGRMALYRMSDLPDDGQYPVDWVQGSALLLRRTLYDQIGGLDEGYFMYFEEVDWCWRARAAGWRALYVGSAHIVHYGGRSSEQAPARTHIAFQQSKLRFFRKRNGWLAAQAMRALMLAVYAWQAALESGKWLLGHRRPLRATRLRTYAAVLASGLKVT